MSLSAKLRFRKLISKTKQHSLGQVLSGIRYIFTFLRFSRILLLMSGFSWTDVPSVTLEGGASPVPHRYENTGGFV